MIQLHKTYCVIKHTYGIKYSNNISGICYITSLLPHPDNLMKKQLTCVQRCQSESNTSEGGACCDCTTFIKIPLSTKDQC